MKIKSIKYIIGVLAITFTLTSCDKSEDAFSTIESNKQEILAFKSIEEFNTTLNKVRTMKPEDRIAWEKSEGFTSFGTICDEFYKTIEPENFKSTDEAKGFVAAHNDKIQLINNSNGDIYCITQEFKNAERYILNQDKMYIIGATVYKKFEEDLVSTEIANIDILRIAKNSNELKSKKAFTSSFTDKSSIQKITNTIVTKNEAYGNNTIGSDTYRIHVWIETLALSNNYKVYEKICNYSRSLGIWWLMEAPIITTFSFSITDSQGNSMNSIFEKTTWVKNYEYEAASFAGYSGSPYFASYNCHAENKVTKTDGRSCICTVNMIY